MSIKRFIKGVKKANKVAEGVYYFHNPTDEREKRARERLEVCNGCEHFKDEPIEALKVEDTRIPEFSGKYCGDCLCVLSYKSRTNEKCEKWQK